MKIKEAVNRIYWRFGGDNNKNPFPVNEKDIEAYQSIKNYVAEKEKEQFHDHQHFAKLFIFTYKRIFEIEGGNIMDIGMTAKRRKIYRLLEKPIHQLIQEFTDMLNETKQYELIESIQGQIKHPATLSEQEKRKTLTKLQNVCTDPKNLAKLKGQVWDYDSVKECLEAEVNQAINRFKGSKK